MRHLEKIVLLFLFAILSVQLFSQKGKDCSNAIEIIDSYSVNAVKGNGSVVEIAGNELGNPKYFEEEHNSVWLTFKAPYKARLTFGIVPKLVSEDWDFMLFKASKVNCESITNKAIEPVRANLARNDEKKNGVTGLDLMSDKEFVPAGVNPNMSMHLEVEKGDEFILVIDNTGPSESGFDLKLNFKEIEEYHIEKEAKIENGGFEFVDMTDEESSSDKIRMNFQVLKEGTEEPVECFVRIVGVMWTDSSLVFDKSSSFSAEIPKNKWFYVNVKKEGYTFSTEKYKATEDLIGSNQKLYITPVEKGSHIVLKEIVFRENTTQLLPTSVNALEQLIDFMKEHPNAEIEVQGHVNAPGMENDGKVRRFSLKRAEQIKDYLVGEGIDGKRIQVAGMGNEFMIYPNPKSYDEEKANRRVEIEILNY